MHGIYAHLFFSREAWLYTQEKNYVPNIVMHYRYTFMQLDC